MSAADIPETHTDPMAMARALVTYIDCPDRVFKAVRAEFDSAPCHRTIQQMRESYLRPMAQVEAWKPHDGYYPDEVSKQAAKTSLMFLARLEAERA